MTGKIFMSEMRQLGVFGVVLTLTLLAGCAGNPPLETQDTSSEADLSIERVLVITAAKDALGTPYRYGGTTPHGLDCSGLTQLSYRAAGIDIPRTSQQQFDTLPKRDKARPGDLLFFGPGGISHVGIYIGHNQMIHAPGSGRTVSVSNITKRYWRSHYRGAAAPAP